MSGDELEELIKDRYGRDSKYVVHEDDAKVFDDVSHAHDMKDPNIWRVKCMVCCFFTFSSCISSYRVSPTISTVAGWS